MEFCNQSSYLMMARLIIASAHSIKSSVDGCSVDIDILLAGIDAKTKPLDGNIW